MLLPGPELRAWRFASEAEAADLLPPVRYERLRRAQRARERRPGDVSGGRRAGAVRRRCHAVPQGSPGAYSPREGAVRRRFPGSATFHASRHRPAAYVPALTIARSLPPAPVSTR
ncbi:hypothetical protein SALBM217S_06469 [Streptomyces griseoloalbus]